MSHVSFAAAESGFTGSGPTKRTLGAALECVLRGHASLDELRAREAIADARAAA